MCIVLSPDPERAYVQLHWITLILTPTVILTSITRSSPWPNVAVGAVADYKKDIFRDRVFGSVEKLSGRHFAANNEEEEDEGEEETERGMGIPFMTWKSSPGACYIKSLVQRGPLNGSTVLADKN